MNDLSPLLNETVDHWLPPTRDLFGKAASADVTTHRARVILSPGELVGPASGEKVSDAKATVWLINHPRQIIIGDTFGLPDGSELQATRIETRVRPWGGSLHKVYLS